MPQDISNDMDTLEVRLGTFSQAQTLLLIYADHVVFSNLRHIREAPDRQDSVSIDELLREDTLI